MKFRKRNINFDHNAIEMPSKCALRTLRKLYKRGYANPSAIYLDGRKTSEMVEKARQMIAYYLGCDTDEIIFTSGATESNSWVQANYPLDVDGRSHHSLDKNLVPKDFPKQLKAIPLVVSETGENLKKEIMDDKDNLYFVDLTQAIGKTDINLHNMSNVMFASASAQKCGGIQGCGILYINKEWLNNHKFKTMIYGSQENGLRGGTTNVPAIICFAEALKEHYSNKELKINEKIRKLILTIANGILEYDLDVHFSTHFNTMNITFNNISSATAVQLFDKNGFNVSSGSACMSGSEEPSSAFLKSGYTKEEALRTIRISIGRGNKLREAKKFVKTLKKIIDNYDK